MKKATAVILTVWLAGAAEVRAGDDTGLWDWNAAPATVHSDKLVVRNRQIAIGDMNAVTDQSRFRFDWNGDGAPPDLPAVTGEASAIANIQTIDTDKNLDLLSSQFAAGGVTRNGSGPAGSDAWMKGLDDKTFAVGTISATAKADETVDARVDLSALAASNVNALNVVPQEGGITSATLGISQVAKNDAKAAAYATDVTINARLAPDATQALSRVSASAFGNVSTIVVRGLPGAD